MSSTSLSDVTEAQWEALAARPIFFGHQSVGGNIVEGLEQLIKTHPEIPLRVLTAEDSVEIKGPGLIERTIGQNMRPETKTRAFVHVLQGGFGRETGAIAMHKYCFVDMQPDTDPEALFASYAASIDRLKEEYPEVVIVHFTLPLVRTTGGWKEQVKALLGRKTPIYLNAKRNRYNQLLRNYYSRDPIFDLARLESTRPDGSLAYSVRLGKRVEMLAPEWTNDGGHLNALGRRYVAEQLLVFLATAIPAIPVSEQP